MKTGPIVKEHKRRHHVRTDAHETSLVNYHAKMRGITQAEVFKLALRYLPSPEPKVESAPSA